MSLTFEQTSNPFHPFIDVEAQVNDANNDEDEDNYKSTLGSLSLSSFSYNTVELIDDSDENDETLYQWLNDNRNNGENNYWDAILIHAYQCTKAIQSSSQ